MESFHLKDFSCLLWFGKESKLSLGDRSKNPWRCLRALSCIVSPLCQCCTNSLKRKMTRRINRTEHRPCDWRGNSGDHIWRITFQDKLTLELSWENLKSFQNSQHLCLIRVLQFHMLGKHKHHFKFAIPEHSSILTMWFASSCSIHNKLKKIIWGRRPKIYEPLFGEATK